MKVCKYYRDTGEINKDYAWCECPQCKLYSIEIDTKGRDCESCEHYEPEEG